MFVPIWALLLVGLAFGLLLYLLYWMRRCVNCLIGCYADLLHASAVAFDNTSTSDEYIHWMDSSLEYHRVSLVAVGLPPIAQNDRRRLLHL